jgi:DNA-binding beta-propeller fold protein YncE
VLVGSGEHRYRVRHDWLQPPEGHVWGDTHGLAQDSAGRIYVAHTVHPTSASKDAVLVFSKDGTFLRSFGAEFAGGAHGLDLRAEGGTEFLYHCDTARRRVVKTTLDGTVVWSVGAPMESGAYEKPEQWCPTNVAFGPDGTVFVGDGYGASFVHAFGTDGTWKRIVARPGSGTGQTSCPHGMTVDTRGTTFTKEPALCVADRGNRRMQYFALDGTPLGVSTAGMRMPCDMKVRGSLLLVPDLESVVTILDERNQPVVHLGDGHPSSLRGAPRSAFVPGKFVHPHDAIWLQDGSILVAEWVPIGRITRLVKES